jgi:hypothetical protein
VRVEGCTYQMLKPTPALGGLRSGRRCAAPRGLIDSRYTPIYFMLST